MGSPNAINWSPFGLFSQASPSTDSQNCDGSQCVRLETKDLREENG